MLVVGKKGIKIIWFLEGGLINGEGVSLVLEIIKLWKDVIVMW